MLRFVLYGLIGWCAEIVWTAGYDAIAGTRVTGEDPRVRSPLSRAERLKLTGRTYLWMFPLYGLAAFAFEPAHDALRTLAWPLRGAIYMTAIFAIEYAAGYLLERVTGRCPWDYSYSRASVGGYIRLDYAPVWFGFGFVLERAHDVINAIALPLGAALSAG